LQPGFAALPAVQGQGANHAQHAAVKAHAALPQVEHFQRVRSVIAGFVKQAVADAPAQHHTQHAVGHQVVDVFRTPHALLRQGGKRRLAQPAVRQEQKQHERRQVGEAIPVDGHRPYREGHGIELRMNQHGGTVKHGPDGLVCASSDIGPIWQNQQ
jgi:hypothetical protein